MNTIEKITKLFEKSGKSARSILLELDLSETALSEWKRGKAKPTTEALTKLADYFDVSVDYLLGRTDIPISPHLLQKKLHNKVLYDLFTAEIDLKGKPTDESSPMSLIWNAIQFFNDANINPACLEKLDDKKRTALLEIIKQFLNNID